jgi:hypothetical protein
MTGVSFAEAAHLVAPSRHMRQYRVGLALPGFYCQSYRRRVRGNASLIGLRAA